MKIKIHKKMTNISLKFKKYYFLGNIIVWGKYFLKYILSFILMLQLTTKLINIFSYFITTHSINSNKNYHSYCNPH